MDSEESINKVLSLLPPGLDATKKKITDYCMAASKTPKTAMDKWETLCATVIGDLGKRKTSVQPIEEIVFTYTWPRLDANVSKGACTDHMVADTELSHRRQQALAEGAVLRTPLHTAHLRAGGPAAGVGV